MKLLKISIFLTIGSVVFTACGKQKPPVDGFVANAQTIYTNSGTAHSYPVLFFFGTLTNHSNKNLKLTIEGRGRISSQLKQFLWIVEKDTISLVLVDAGRKWGNEESIILKPDSSVKFQLRPSFLHFLNEEGAWVGDSNYYKKYLREQATKGSIYYNTSADEKIKLSRKNPFYIMEGNRKDSNIIEIGTTNN